MFFIVFSTTQQMNMMNGKAREIVRGTALKSRNARPALPPASRIAALLPGKNGRKMETLSARHVPAHFTCPTGRSRRVPAPASSSNTPAKPRSKIRMESASPIIMIRVMESSSCSATASALVRLAQRIGVGANASHGCFNGLECRNGMADGPEVLVERIFELTYPKFSVPCRHPANVK